MALFHHYFFLIVSFFLPFGDVMTGMYRFHEFVFFFCSLDILPQLLFPSEDFAEQLQVPCFLCE